MDDVDCYIVNWTDDDSSFEESTSLTNITITQLTPNTTYYVTVTAVNICGTGPVSDTFMVITNMILVIRPSVPTSMGMTTAQTTSSSTTTATTFLTTLKATTTTPTTTTTTTPTTTTPTGNKITLNNGR